MSKANAINNKVRGGLGGGAAPLGSELLGGAQAPLGSGNSSNSNDNHNNVNRNCNSNSHSNIETARPLVFCC